ncbi:UNVERIFIED_CONTAM: hypothetical protein GTU68_047852 [Idotea baltica]|nr:hypothetical protein [Idotea baltica]
MQPVLTKITGYGLLGVLTISLSACGGSSSSSTTETDSTDTTVSTDTETSTSSSTEIVSDESETTETVSDDTDDESETTETVSDDTDDDESETTETVSDDTDDDDTETSTVTFASKALLGEALFSDTSLSFNSTQSCSSCHNSDIAFIDNSASDTDNAVSLGDDGFSLGNRNSPTLSYIALNPSFTGDDEDAEGGFFHDGRAADLAAQAGEPFLNPLEMGMPDQESVVSRITADSDYVAAFEELYGDDVFDDTETAFAALADSIVNFQQTDIFSPFDSKYDRALAGTYEMTDIEEEGMDLFFSNQASCLDCHHVDDLPNRSEDELFTSHRYFNIGVPVNQTLNALLESAGQQDELRANGDLGLFNNPAVNGDDDTRGLFKVPTLRNVAVTGPYMHNGVFANLQTVIHFYDHQGGNGRNGNGNNNRRPINPETGEAWGDPETDENISNNRLRMPQLDDDEVEALECFLRTLTDAAYESELSDSVDCS